MRFSTYLIPWLTIFVPVTLGLGSINWQNYGRLARNASSCSGVVVDRFPSRHQIVSYKYEVDGVLWTGEMQSRSPNPAFELLHPGDKVAVYYDRNNPGNSLLGDPKYILIDETIAISLGGAATATFFLFLIAKHNRSEKADPKGSSRQNLKGTGKE